MAISSLPEFSDLPGNIIFPENIFRERAFESHFILQGKKANLQKLCDNWFNTATGGKVQASPASTAVLVTFTNCACPFGCGLYDWNHTVCTNENCSRAVLSGDKDTELGNLKYLGITFTVLIKLRRGGIYAFPAYNFVDQGIVLAMAREVLGIPTTYASVWAPNSNLDPASMGFQLAGIVRTVQDPETNSDKDVSFFNIRRIDQPTGTQQIQTLKSRFMARSAIQNRLMRMQGQNMETLFTMEEIHHLTNVILREGDWITMKQFRGPWQGELASVKQVQTFSASRVRYRDGRVLPGTYSIQLRPDNPVVNRFFDMKGNFGLGIQNLALSAFQFERDYEFYAKDVLWNGVE